MHRTFHMKDTKFKYGSISYSKEEILTNIKKSSDESEAT